MGSTQGRIPAFPGKNWPKTATFVTGCNAAGALPKVHPESLQQTRRTRHVCDQKFHLVHQNAAVAQNEVFPQTGNVRRVQQRHICLLWGAVALAVVAGFAGGVYVHPGVDTVLGKGNDVLAGEIVFMQLLAALGTHIAVARNQFAVCQCLSHRQRPLQSHG